MVVRLDLDFLRLSLVLFFVEGSILLLVFLLLLLRLWRLDTRPEELERKPRERRPIERREVADLDFKERDKLLSSFSF